MVQSICIRVVCAHDERMEEELIAGGGERAYGLLLWPSPYVGL